MGLSFGGQAMDVLYQLSYLGVRLFDEIRTHFEQNS
jgi:hypothetical protein